jgi:hypothetical protein
MLHNLADADADAIFCIVIINKQFIHLNPSITLGNHQRNGAAPIFINSGVIIAYENMLLVMIIWFVRNFIIAKNSREVEAKA